ncbi:MAG: hypothetical protein KF784_05030 [Fimbriimonadaceae bacterium]|nr:hypothetical protein [Fimbriimonadaceae bacterium]
MLIAASLLSLANTFRSQWPDRVSLHYEGIVVHQDEQAKIDLRILKSGNTLYVSIKDDSWSHRVLANGQTIYSSLAWVDDEPTFNVYSGVPLGYWHMPMLPGKLLLRDTFTLTSPVSAQMTAKAKGIVWGGSDGRPGERNPLEGEVSLVEKEGDTALAQFTGASPDNNVRAASIQSNHVQAGSVWVPGNIEETHFDSRGEIKYVWKLIEAKVNDKADLPPTIESLLGPESNVQDNRLGEPMGIRYSDSLGTLDDQLTEARRINEEVKEKEPGSNPLPWIIGAAVLISVGTTVIVLAKKGSL